MKKLLVLSIAILLLATMNSFGQTKKIAHRSHSGDEAEFDIYSLDDFGGPPPEYMREWHKQRDSLTIVDSLKKCVKPNATLNAPSIVPISTEEPKAKPKPKVAPKLKKKQTMKPQSTTAKVKGTATLKTTEKKATDFIKKTTKSIEKATKETSKKEKGSLSWLVVLLTIPALMIMFFKIKK